MNQGRRHGDAPVLVQQINAALEELKHQDPPRTWVDSLVEAWDHREDDLDGQEAGGV